jgi:hypothetical protein
VLLSYQRYLGLADGRCNSLRSWASSVTGSLGLGVPLEMGAAPAVHGARPRPAGAGPRAAARAACTACYSTLTVPECMQLSSRWQSGGDLFSQWPACRAIDTNLLAVGVRFWCQAGWVRALIARARPPPPRGMSGGGGGGGGQPPSKKPHKASFWDRLLDSVLRPAWSSPPEQSGPAHTVQVIYEACRQPSYGQKIDNFEGGGQKIDNLWASVRCQRPC